MKKFIFELLGLSSGILFAASFIELFSVGSMAGYYKGHGILCLIAGIGVSIPWLVAGEHTIQRASAFKSFKRKGSSRHLDWEQFEYLTAAYLRNQGFKVENNTKKGPDGGVDVRVERGGKKGIVQCKHYRTTKCSVNVVRELKGVMASERIDFGVVACTSGFSKEAWSFAKTNKITLLSEADMIKRKRVYT